MDYASGFLPTPPHSDAVALDSWLASSLPQGTPTHPDEQSWASQIDALLRALHDEVQAAKAGGEDWLDPWVLAGYRAAYEQIIALGHHQNQPPTVRTGKRGPIGRSPSASLLRRLDEQREQVLRFAHNFQVPFDNNLVERDIRMIKIQQKISGSWRTTTGADRFFALRAYISTTRKQGRDTLDALARLARHTPWLPTSASPNQPYGDLNSHAKRGFLGRAKKSENRGDHINLA